MKLSVVIPVYNVSQYIENCLRSIFVQTYKEPLEIIIVDDCGSDNSIHLAHELVEQKAPSNQKYKFLQHEKNRGLSAARNTCLQVAEGDYVYFLDSDDLITDDCFEVLLNLSEKYKSAEMIVGQFDEFHEGGDYYPSEWKQMDGVYEGDIIGTYLSLRIPATAWNKMIDRKCLLNNNLFFEEGLLHEDYLWSFQVACLLKKVVVADRVTYHYLQRSGSIQHGFDYVKHQLHYARASALQAKFVFEKSLQRDLRIFRYIDRFRSNIVGDLSVLGETDAVQKVLKLFHDNPYWTVFQLLCYGAMPKEILRRLLKPDWK